MAFKDMSLPDRLIACHVAAMKHPVFCILGGVTQIGKVEITEEVDTAGTDGTDVYYNPHFIASMSKKQLLYLILHEAMHKCLHHCTEYVEVKKKFPDEFAQAVDYVVNGTIEDMDNGAEKFLERPTSIPPLVNPKYANMSVLEVIRDLRK